MLQIQHLKKTFKSPKIELFGDFNLEVKKGEFITLFGPNGCGKSTLLQIIAGLLEHDEGEIKFGRSRLRSQKIGFIFQEYQNSLYPWLSVKENIAFPLKIAAVPVRIIEKKIESFYHKFAVDIPLTAYPYQLSGGQQQFVCLLRGLIINPDVYLLDEPFSSLDYQTSLLLLEKLSQIWCKVKTTTLFVSHEIDEAIFLAQRIVLLSNKPTTIVKIFFNPLPFPRTIKMISTLQFAKIKDEVLRYYTKGISPADLQQPVYV